jgi:hypothetical protein
MATAERHVTSVKNATDIYGKNDNARAASGAVEDVKMFALMSIAESLATISESLSLAVDTLYSEDN